MNHKNISASFIIQNVNTPELILEAFGESATGTNDSSNVLYIECEKIAESDESLETKKSLITSTIKKYHKMLYTKSGQ